MACENRAEAPARPEEQDLAPAPGRLARLLTAEPGDRLLAYAWDDGPEIRSVFAVDQIPLDYGEAAPQPDSLLHLNFNEGAGSTLRDLSPARRELRVEGMRWVRGRFGYALAAHPGQVPSLTVSGEGPLLGDLWTLELWARPDERPVASQRLVSESGAFELVLGPDGRLTASLELGDSSIVLHSAEPLELGRWNHVAVVCDAREFRHLRLVVNGDLRWHLLPEGSVDRGSGTLVLGGWGSGDSPFAGAIDQLMLVERALPTAELLARSEDGVEPGPHPLRLRFESGLRQEQLWASPELEPLLRTSRQWSRGALRQVVADEEGIRWVPARWERSWTEEAPAPRTTHPTLFVGKHRVFVFGGEVRDSHVPPMVNTDDTWLYDIEARRWTVADSPASPSPRCHQDFAYSPDHDLVLLVGGWRNEAPGKPLLSDLWVYHVAEGRWVEQTPTDVRIPAHSDAGVVYHAGARRFLVFRQNDVYEYDPETNRWSKRPRPEAVDSEGRPRRLAGRISPIMGYDPASGWVVRFGGALAVDGERIYTDTTALYDYDRNRWIVLEPNPRPAPRVRGGFALDVRRGSFVLFGGVRDQFSQRYDDLWSFSPTERRWTRLAASNPPSPRGGFYGMAYDPELDVFVVVAGRLSHTEWTNETWHLRIDPAEPGTATYVFDRDGFPGAKRWFAASSVPPGARVDFRFAGSGDGLSWSEWVAEPGLLRPSASRYIKVEVELAPGDGGKAPRVTSMGFDRASPASLPGADLRSLPIAPLVAGDASSP